MMKATFMRLTKIARGFTLIETIVGIVVLSLSFAVLSTLLYPLAHQSAEQVHQIRAAELGQSMINEILGKAFDDNSDMSGGYLRCSEASAPACSEHDDFDDGESRENYDDVDDYNGLTALENSEGATLEGYTGFSLLVTVVYDGDFNGVDDESNANPVAKLITVMITTPQDFDFVFSVYRTNF
jgi:MSHA pilin protein MshD